jgi:glutamate carboxypeptidase
MDDSEQRITSYLDAHRDEIVRDLVLLTEAQSSSTEMDSLSNCSRVLQGIIRGRLGGEVTVYPQSKAGDHLSWEWDAGPKKMLVVGHYDTVWPKDSLKLRRDESRLYGPGVLDMKSGLVSAIWALHALQALGMNPGKKVILVCNSDEELGSVTSQPLFKELAKDAMAALICEPTVPNTGQLKIARKGSESYLVEIRGLAAHAGSDYWAGANAIEEMARTIQYLHGLSDRRTGTTVNVGLCKGGLKSNVIADYAQMEIDCRCETVEEQDRLRKIIMELKPSVPGTSISAERLSWCPPMEKTEGNLALFEIAKDVGKRLGMELEYSKVGGASDGNYIASLGVPTLDGLGAVGDGAHALHEQIRLDQLLPRVALLAGLILRI